jgi:hypothetical protein
VNLLCAFLTHVLFWNLLPWLSAESYVAVSSSECCGVVALRSSCHTRNGFGRLLDYIHLSQSAAYLLVAPAMLCAAVMLRGVSAGTFLVEGVLELAQ